MKKDDAGGERLALFQKIVSRIGVPVERLCVQAGDIQTSCLAAGAGEPVLLIHGGDAGAGGLRWFPVIGPLSARFRVIVPDVVGFGESDKPAASYDRSFFSAWLARLFEGLGLEKATLVGHSAGGAIALQFTLDHPGCVERLVLVNAAGLGKGAQRVPVHLMLRMMFQNLFPTREASRWFLERYGLFDPQVMDETMVDVEAYGCNVIRMARGRRVFWLGRGRVITPIPLEHLARITRPTLLVWGENDNQFPAALAQAAGSRISRSQFKLIPRAGHNCFYEQLDMFNEVVMGFLLENDGR